METRFNQAEFYSRQTVLPEIGTDGQKKIKSSHVTIIGIGGIGTVSALYLALSGVGKLTVVDLDTVEFNNLHRQVLFSLEDLRYPKVEAASRRIAKINPEVQVEPVAENLDSENAASIIADSDCVVDGLDNMTTRYIINRVCVDKKIPFVFGGAIGMEGNVAVFKSPETACLECIMPGVRDGDLPTCDTRGVLGATTGIIGALQAVETIKLLAGINESSKGKLMIFDFAQSYFRTINLKIRKDCEACQIKTSLSDKYPKRIAWVCGSNTVTVKPESPLRLNFDEISRSLARNEKILLKTPIVLVFEYEGSEISLFNGGRMLIKNVRSEEDAIATFKGVVKRIEGAGSS